MRAISFMSAAAIIMMAVPLTAGAQPRAPRSIDDCEKIEEAMAYNACLASFGPSPGEKPARGSVEQAEEAASAGRPATRRGVGRTGRPIPQGAISGSTRGGRQFLVIPTQPRQERARSRSSRR